MKTRTGLGLVLVGLAGAAQAQTAPSAVAVPASPAVVASPRAAEPDERQAVSAPLFEELEKKLAAAYTPARKASFTPVTSAEHKRFGDAFRLLIDEAESRPPGSPTAPLRSAFDSLGFQVEAMTIAPGDTILVLTEAPQRLRGSGLFLVRTGPVKPVVIMAPHPRNDRGTDLMGQRLFALTKARAYVQATMHRKALAPDGTVADPAHRYDTFFQVATEILEAHSAQLFVQLHGFESARHGDVDPRTAVIVSDGLGVPRPGTKFEEVAEKLSARHKKGYVAIWGVDTLKLGGTTNAQARYINPREKSTFMHVEMAAPVREDALKDTGGRLPPRGSFFESLMYVVFSQG